MIKSCEKLFAQFINDFPKLGCLSEYKFAQFNPHLKRYFGNLGKKSGYVSYWTSKETSEYLVDLCWYVENQTGEWMELALEQELSSDDIEEVKSDFYKLLDVKAFLKIGIFRPKKAERYKILELFQELISRHKIRNPEERYLTILMFWHSSRDPHPNKLEISGHEFDFLGNRTDLGTEFYDWE